MPAKAKKTVTRKKAKADDIRLKDTHPNHDNHMCHVIGLRNMKKAGRLAKDAKYNCFICGRAAKSKKNLCQPVER